MKGKKPYRLAVALTPAGGVISVVVRDGAAQTGLPGRGGLPRLWRAVHVEKCKGMRHSLTESLCWARCSWPGSVP
jgi:hypothetical protein